ncbi:hypothetical protein DPMN_043309 [Dreissena polymorpha]|uniref:LRAT domain-containing protein n=1 Tax=Dreissena polymorpha TaxID=45954 RepID=A0A9D4HZI5_DREPO|nr:hypothetical protein DPMN_043309 [Dreissena polymorpha]
MQFTNKGQRRLFRIQYPPGHCLPPETVAKNAEDLVANPTKWGNYDLLTNNCEHFASKCKTGKAESNQVNSKINDAIQNPALLLVYAVCGSAASIRNTS